MTVEEGRGMVWKGTLRYRDDFSEEWKCSGVGGISKRWMFLVAYPCELSFYTLHCIYLVRQDGWCLGWNFLAAFVATMLYFIYIQNAHFVMACILEELQRETYTMAWFGNAHWGLPTVRRLVWQDMQLSKPEFWLTAIPKISKVLHSWVSVGHRYRSSGSWMLTRGKSRAI